MAVSAHIPNKHVTSIRVQISNVYGCNSGKVNVGVSKAMVEFAVNFERLLLLIVNGVGAVCSKLIASEDVSTVTCEIKELNLQKL